MTALELWWAFVDFTRSDTALWLLTVAGAGVIAATVAAHRTPRGKQGGWKKAADQ